MDIDTIGSSFTQYSRVRHLIKNKLNHNLNFSHTDDTMFVTSHGFQFGEGLWKIFVFQSQVRFRPSLMSVD